MARKGIQLCYPFEEKRLAKWRPPYIIQPKLDGDRCRAVIDNDGRVVLLSSEENIITSVPHINASIASLHLRDIELDGELYLHGAPHSFIHGTVSREVNISPDAGLIEYHIFDIVNEQPQVQRLNTLIDIIPSPRTGIPLYRPICIVPSQIIFSLEDIMRSEEVFEEHGYEGFVVREATSLYVRKRSTSLMKFKPRKEDIYEISGYSPQVDKLKNVKPDILGRLICSSDIKMPPLYEYPPIIEPPDGYFAVGSGSLLTQDGRKTLWEAREGIVGKWARIKYQHLTHARGVPRFPVVVEIIDAPI